MRNQNNDNEVIDMETPDTSITTVTAARGSAVVPASAPTMAVATADSPAQPSAYNVLPCSRIKIAYSVSANMPDGLLEGSIVMRASNEQWVPLSSPPRSLKVLILAARVYYKEWLTSESFASGLSPKSYPTKEAALADGQTVEWGANGDRPSVSPAVDVTMLVERPESLDNAGEDAFIFALDGKLWAPCIMTIDKSNAKKALDSMSRLILRDMTVNGVPRDKARLNAFFCSLTINRVPRGKTKLMVPSFTVLMDKDHKAMVPSEEFNAQFATLMNSFSSPESMPTASIGDDDDLPY